MVGHETGFRIYNTDPMAIRFVRTFKSSPGREARLGIGHAAMLHRTNFIALVGGGRNPKFPLNKVVVYDDLKKNYTLCLEFFSPVLNVHILRIRIVAVSESQVYVHAFSSHPKLLSTFDTAPNPHGIADLADAASESGSAEILAFPGRQQGQIQIVDILPGGQERNVVRLVKAHKLRIRSIALDRSGSLVASASETGTIIRVHSVANCSLVHEFRRGLDRAIVYAMRFSPDGLKLAVLLDKDTLHVFRLGASNREHMLLRMPLFSGYFASSWLFVLCRIDTGGVSGERGVLGWLGETSVIIVWKNRGRWEKYVLKEGNGEQENWELVREEWRGFGDLEG